MLAFFADLLLLALPLIGAAPNPAAGASPSFGFADLENRVPATAETVYAIGSITKQFTAAAVLLLADEGKLSLVLGLGADAPRRPSPP